MLSGIRQHSTELRRTQKNLKQLNRTQQDEGELRQTEQNESDNRVRRLQFLKEALNSWRSINLKSFSNKILRIEIKFFRLEISLNDFLNKYPLFYITNKQLRIIIKTKSRKDLEINLINLNKRLTSILPRPCLSFGRSRTNVSFNVCLKGIKEIKKN